MGSSVGGLEDEVKLDYVDCLSEIPPRHTKKE